jgi:ribonuclease HI
MNIIIACDGGCRGNQNDNNVGGYGVVMEYNGNRKELKGGEKNTTNNKMELLACIKGLEFVEKVKDTPIQIMTDSAYLCNCFQQKWYVGWKKNGWKNSKKEPVANRELWEKILKLVEGKNITWIKVKGHSDCELNNRADELANEAMDELS